jgi:lysophospholipase L1-like esterase
MRMLPIIISLTLGLLLLSACAARGSDSPQPASRQTIRYLALGDSYTIGESVSETERWPNQLAERIKTSPQFAAQIGGTEGGLEVTLIARTGWTTNELWQGLQKVEVNPPYDLVSLLIGVNNQYRGYPLDDYRAEFRYLLGKAIEYAENDPQKVFVVSIPDWGFTPFAAGRNREQIAAEIDAFNAINHTEAERAGVAYVDITPYSRTATANSDLIAPDGLHPSGKMYTGWVEKILPVALKALEK